jgi:hypothetical protein
MAMPIILRKVGSKWTVHVNMPGVVAYGGKGPRMKMYPLTAVVPVVKTSKTGVDLVPGGEPGKFTKEEAKYLAHKIGVYMFGFGDFVYAYTEGY